MIKKHPGPNLPVVEVRSDGDDTRMPYNVSIPGDPNDMSFPGLLDVIDYLRREKKGRCYIVNGDECFVLGWSTVLPPWEGPDMF